jgi:SAM-dependent methyltransferase
MIERLTLGTDSNEELQRLHLSRYEFAGKFVKNKVVLDAACGTGYGTLMLAQRGAKTTTGVDSSEEAITYAQKNYEFPQLTFVVNDVQTLTYNNEMDFVVSFETIGHLKDPKSFLRGVTRALTAEGMLLISTPVRQRGHLEDKPDYIFAYREWNEREFTELLAPYFSRIDIQYQYDFKKQWFPYSRTLSKVAARIFFPKQWREFSQYKVQTATKLLTGIPIAPACMIAVCTDPIRHE